MLHPSCLAQTRHRYRIAESRTATGFVQLVILVIQFLYQKKINGKQPYLYIPVRFLANVQINRDKYDKHDESLLVTGSSRHSCVVYA